MTKENETNIFIERVKWLMFERRMSQVDLAKASNVSKATISNMVAGKFEPRSSTKIAIAKALGTTLAWLEGDEGAPPPSGIGEIAKSPPLPPGARPVEKKKIPMLGSIACGPPSYVEPGHVETYREAPANIDADYCITAHGNSMIGADIREGDIIFVKSQDIVENGQIAVVCIGEETTLKRFYYDRKRSVVQLLPENKDVPPVIKTGAEIDEVRVQGLVVGIYRDLSQISATE